MSSQDSCIFQLKKINNFGGVYLIAEFKNREIQLIDSGNFKDVSQVKSYPIFNRDYNWFTPTFMLQQDIFKVKSNFSIFQKLHQSRVTEAIQQKSELFIPRPSQPISYCCICKNNYEDYIEHSTSSSHLLMTSRSKFKKDIIKFCKIFSSKRVKRSKVKKVKNIKKQSSLKNKKNMEIQKEQKCQSEMTAQSYKISSNV